MLCELAGRRASGTFAAMRRLLMALLVAIPVVVTLASGAGSPVVHALPPGFSDVAVASVARPTAVEHLPNGRTAVLEQSTGRVRLIDTNTGQLLPGFALDLAVCGSGERGLLGFAPDPDFSATGRVYVFYVASFGGSCRTRVSAFRMVGDSISPSSEQVLIQIMNRRSNHNGGDVEIGNDGFLYVSVGDDGADPRGDSGSAGANDAAQDLGVLHGKILRLDRMTGFPAAGNPYLGHPDGVDCRGNYLVLAPQGSVCREIFAHGLRNPYRFAFDPNTSATRFFINDVGQSGVDQREEVNEGAIGANYGWNTCEGPCAVPGLTNPIVSYDNTRGRFITAGAFVPDGVWPSEYDGGYLFADGGSDRIWLRRADGSVDFTTPFITGRSGIADMAFVLELGGWALYYTQVFSGQVRKITFSTSPSGPAGPLAYERLPTATRPFDSRTTAPPARIRGGHTRLIPLGPEAVGADAALVNITFASPSAATFAAVWEPRTTRPATSNLNAPALKDVANASIVPVDAQGRIILHTQATSDVIVDLAGVFVAAPGPTAAGRFQPAQTKRVVDSRQAAGPGNEHTRSGPVVNVPISSRAGVPPAGVDAVVLVVAGIGRSIPVQGWLTAYAGGTSRPPSSNLNVNGDGDVRTNLVVVPLGADGSVDVYLSDVPDLIVEVIGWFTDDTVGASGSGRFQLINPTREVDSRNNIGFGPLEHLELQPFNPASAPDGAAAVAQNLTFAPTGGWGFVGALAEPSAPLITNLNGSRAGQTRAALAITPLSGSGSETFRAESPITFRPHHFLVDIFGYFE